MVSVEPVSEDSVLIRFRLDSPAEMSATLTQKILCYRAAIEKALTPVIRDLVPGYTTLLCVYDPARIDFRRVCAAIHSLSTALEKQTAHRSQLRSLPTNPVDIPVYYDPEVGLDLCTVANQNGLTVDDVIRIHTCSTYHVFAMGFCPGFAFLGPVDPSIAVPRRKTPRPNVPAGSVAIANRQTAVYPIDSPGGWCLIGRSPVSFFSKDALSLLQAGDQVRFRRISRETFLDQGGTV